MRGFTNRFDQLALLGKLLDHEDKIVYIIDGLPEDYKSVVNQVEGRDVSPSIVEIHEKLINKEAKLLAMITSPPSFVPITANVASSKPKQFNNQHYRGNGSNSNWNGNKSQQHSSPRQDTRQSKGYQGRCQICGTFGHSAKRCPQLLQQANTRYNASPFRPWKPRANFVMSSPNPTNAWLMDSWATHHLTSDLNNMTLHQPYNGDDSVLIGDGSGLSITYTGSLSLPSLTRKLHLNNVLCVPNNKKNLVFVYRLCNANKVSVEFFPAQFQLKDLRSGVPLIQGKTKDQLYEWPTQTPILQSFFTSTSPKTTMSDLHFRL